MARSSNNKIGSSSSGKNTSSSSKSGSSSSKTSGSSAKSKSGGTSSRSASNSSGASKIASQSGQGSSSNSRNGSSNGRSSGKSSSSRSSTSSSRTGNRNDTGLLKLFTEQLQDIYYVEKQLVRSLTRMAKAAQSEDLRNAFEKHREETETQMERLVEVFEMLDRDPKAKKCEAMDGLLEEAKELMEDFADDAALDAALVGAAQKVEHYEIATYGSLCAWAEQLGLEEALPLLEETLQEEKQTDQDLTELAVSMLNEMAEDEDQQGRKMQTASTSGNGSSSRSR